MSQIFPRKGPVAAEELIDATGLIDVSLSAAPVAGQSLVATDATHATWQNAAGTYTNEDAQDAVGTILLDTATIDLTYDDATPTISADVKANSVAVTYMHATATDVLFGRSTAGAGAGEEIALTAAGRALIDDANAAAQATTLGLGTGNSPTWVGGTFTGSVSVGGNLVVSGSTISSGVIELEGNYVTLNDGYTADAAVTSGLVKVIDPTTTQTTGAASGFVLGVAGVSDPTVAVTSSAGFAETNIISVAGAGANDGLYEVKTVAAGLLTVRGVGLNANIEAWARSNFSVAVSAVGATITKVNVAVDRTGTDGKLERAYGSANGLTYSDYYYVGGTDVAVADGGTGLSSYAVGDVVYASGTGTLAGLADVATGQVLRSGGVNTAPAYGQVVLTTDVTGILPIANGGTNSSTAVTALAALGGAPVPDVQTSSTPGAGVWTKPTGAYTSVRVEMWGAGGQGGGGGCKTNAAANTCIGGRGGGGGAYSTRNYAIGDLSATENFSVGTGGTGAGQGGPTGAGDGSDGASGTATTFGTTIRLTAGGGGGGRRGKNSAENGSGGTGGGTGGSGNVGLSGGSDVGGAPLFSVANANGGSGGGGSWAAGRNAEFGGAGGGGTAQVPLAGGAGGSSVFGGAGGGAGACCAADGTTLVAAAAGGNTNTYAAGGGGAAGTSGASPTAGTAGTDGTTVKAGTGGGGGGGTVTNSTNGQNGGAGGARGGGGGGGGIGSTGGANTGGTGGVGGNGHIRITTL